MMRFRYNQRLETLKLKLKQKTDFIERLNIELSTNKNHTRMLKKYIKELLLEHKK